MVWIVLLLVLVALAGMALWVDRRRKEAGGAGTDRAHGPESRYFDRYGSGGGGGGGIGGGDGGGGGGF